MVDRESLKAQIDAEMAKYEQPSDGDKIEPTEVPEVKETKIEAETQEEVRSETAEDPYLKEAMEMGFNPNYQGPNKKTPEQFVRDGSFFRKIDDLKKENKEIKTLLQQQIDRANKIEQAKLQSKLNEIKQDKIQKVADGDLEGYRLAEQQEAAFQEQLKVHNVQQPQQQEVTPAGNEITPVVREFLEENKAWLNVSTPKNKEMAEDMDFECRRLATNNPGMSEKEILEAAMNKIKRTHSDYFENKETKRPASVAKSTVGSSSGPSSLDKLSSQQRQFLRDAQKHGLKISADDYIKQLKSSGELQ